MHVVSCVYRPSILRMADLGSKAVDHHPECYSGGKFEPSVSVVAFSDGLNQVSLVSLIGAWICTFGVCTSILPMLLLV
jgi:hypothetical protein